MTTAPATPRGAGLIERWHDHLDVDDDTPRLTIGEGGTPLVHAARLSRRLGVEVHLKLELANPTGSFKDRGMCVAVARAMQSGATTLICASTGNTSASAAAFAAAAGLKCVVIVPSGKIAAGKLLQAQIAGALVIQIDGSFDDGLDAVRALADRPGFALVNSVNPYRIEGQKTGAWEVCEDLGMQPPDWLCTPVGNAGNITAYWQGFREWHERGLVPLGEVLTSDLRCRLALGDFFALVASADGLDPLVPGRRFDAVVVDIDHSPRHVLAPGNAALYEVDGLRELSRHLRPGGVFALWSNDPPDDVFLAALAEVFVGVQVQVVVFHNPLQGRDSTNSVYLARVPAP